MNHIPSDPDIPFGRYCYSVIELAEGEPAPVHSNRFGHEVREALYHPGRKEVLCPYWRLTDHGTVRCTKLCVEAISEIGDFRQNLAKAVAHFGSERALEAVRVGDHFLPDEIKICGINMENDDGWNI